MHLVNGALIHAIARRLRLDPIAAILAAALFLLFPASAEAVVWASGIQDVLMTTASLAFVLATLDARHPAVLLGCALAGLFSKETAVVMPLLAAAALWARRYTPCTWRRSNAGCLCRCRDGIRRVARAGQRGGPLPSRRHATSSRRSSPRPSGRSQCPGPPTSCEPRRLSASCWPGLSRLAPGPSWCGRRRAR